MSIVQEFKEFAVKGNVVDMAVGIIIGGAFGKIVSSFVNDIIMPPLGLLLGGVSFSEYRVVLKEAVVENGVTLTEAVTLNWGMFLQTAFDFVIVAAAIFVAIRMMNKLRKTQEDAPQAPAEPPADIKLLTEIRDALRK